MASQVVLSRSTVSCFVVTMCKCETSRKNNDKVRNKEGRGEAGALDSKTTVRVRTSGTFCYDVILRLRKRSYWSHWSLGVSLSTVKHRADDAAPAATVALCLLFLGFRRSLKLHFWHTCFQASNSLWSVL
jgi:hypothetical protein